jgi:uncharacterized protein YsxB (DUF464 family)
MILVCIGRTAGSVRQVTVRGHAQAAPKGEDLICAAVSALVQTYLFSLQRLLRIDTDAVVRDGYISLTLPAELSQDTRKAADLLAESMLIGLEEINSSYPGYLKVKHE